MKSSELLKVMQDVHEVFPLSDLPPDFRGTHGFHIDREKGVLTLMVWVPDPHKEGGVCFRLLWFDGEDVEINVKLLKDTKKILLESLK